MITKEFNRKLSFYQYFVDVLKWMRPALSKDENRRVLSNFYARRVSGDRVEFGAADGKRIHMARVSLDYWKGLTLDVPVENAIDQYKAIFTGGTVLLSKLEDEQNYPNISTVMPEKCTICRRVITSDLSRIQSATSVFNKMGVFLNDNYLIEALSMVVETNFEVRVQRPTKHKSKYGSPYYTRHPVVITSLFSEFECTSVVMPLNNEPKLETRDAKPIDACKFKYDKEDKKK